MKEIRNCQFNKLEIRDNNKNCKNCSAPKTGQGSMFFSSQKVLYSLKLLLRRWRLLKSGQNNQFIFLNSLKLFSFLAKPFFFQDSGNTTLYKLNLMGIWPTYGWFHNEKLPSHKRVKWGRLAENSCIMGHEMSKVIR